MSTQEFVQGIREKTRLTAILAVAAALMAVVVLALYDSVASGFDDVELGDSAAGFLGGGDFATITGWLNAEIFSIAGPAAVIAAALVIAVGGSAGAEEARVLALELAHPVRRSGLVLALAGVVVVAVVVICAALWAGLAAAMPLADGDRPAAGDVAAACLHLAFLGLAFGALGLALGAGTGQRSLAYAGVGGFAVVGYLVDGLAPLTDATAWIETLTPFHYYSGSDPLTGGVDVIHLGVLALSAAVLTGLALVLFERRDLRA